MSHYKHITPEEREKILLLNSQNYTITYIANSIGRDKSTISQSDLLRQIVVHVLEIGKVILLPERRMVLVWLHSQIEKVDFFYV